MLHYIVFYQLSIANYYYPDRTHQALEGNTEIPTSVKQTKLKATPVLNELYHSVPE
jgi:hypothetical protein